MSKKKVPDEEMFLAKLIQNAKSRELKAVRGELYVEHNGRGRLLYDEENTAGCCAVGAARLEDDTDNMGHAADAGLVAGNDRRIHDGEDPAWYTIGMCFQDAMEDE